jgi:hypothetical protein
MTTLKAAILRAINPKFFNSVSQIAHFFTMYGICFTLSVFWGWKGLTVGLVGCTVYALIHEFWYDPRYENTETRGSDLQDFVFLEFGQVVAVLSFLLARHLHRL